MASEETNFPVALTGPFLRLMNHLQGDFRNNLLTADSFAHYLRGALRHPDMASAFAGRMPPYWWFHYILRSHSHKFDQKFVAFLQNKLVKTRVRSLSGIIPLTLFTNGVGCPFHCIYCPSEPGMPKSYLSDEPAVRRAIRHGFDPYRQTAGRLSMFALSNHPTDKVEIIIKGGTFSFYPRSYRRQFMKRIFDACNSFGGPRKKSKNLREAQTCNTTSAARIVGINIETRPDYITPRELSFFRELGITHVELGVQAPDDDIYRTIRRGHHVSDVVYATMLLKDWGFKVGYHLMLNLPGSSPEKDFSLISRVFSDDRFKPDHLKLYPTTITPYTALSEWYKTGAYVPYPVEEMKRVILRLKTEIVPPWVRIGRLTRDITTTMMEVRSFPPNLRELLQKKLVEEKKICSCIRCREIKNQHIIPPVRVHTITYNANAAREFFIEYTDARKNLLAFLRLRIPIQGKKAKTLPPAISGASIVRELHVYGQMLPLGKKGAASAQHKHLGRRLLQKAERLSKAHGTTKIAVIAGIGTRPYYEGRGYLLADTYMVKSL